MAEKATEWLPTPILEVIVNLEKEILNGDWQLLHCSITLRGRYPKQWVD